MKKRDFALIAAACLATVTIVALAHHDSPESMQARVAAVGSLNIMTEEQAAAARAEAEKAAAANLATASAAAGPADGESVYQASCVACHGAGIAGAPKVGDAGAWTSRIAEGLDVLVKHAIEGFQGDAGVMPAKGGNTALSDDQVAAAVEYMMENSQ